MRLIEHLSFFFLLISIKQNWLKAADSVLFLVNSCQTIYSPILIRYMYAVFMQMHFFFINYDLYNEWNGYLDSNMVIDNDIDFKLTTNDNCTEQIGDDSNCSSRADRSESLSNSYSTSRTNSMTDSINMIHNGWKKLEELPYSETVNKTNQRLIDERLEQMTERQFDEELTKQFE